MLERTSKNLFCCKIYINYNVDSLLTSEHDEVTSSSQKSYEAFDSEPFVCALVVVVENFLHMDIQCQSCPATWEKRDPPSSNDKKLAQNTPWTTFLIVTAAGFGSGIVARVNVDVALFATS